jgi:curved DNA-binding protein CbpA
MNYYLVLGIARDADPDTIRSAFRSLVRRYHPDAGEGSSAQKFREIVEAYETLADPVRRQRYDDSLQPVRPRVRDAADVVSWWRPAPEPLRPERSSRRSATFVREPSAWFVDDPFDELFRAFEHAFFSRF